MKYLIFPVNFGIFQELLMQLKIHPKLQLKYEFSD